MLLVLAAAALFVYLRLEQSLDDSVDSGVHTRLDAVAASGDARAGTPAEAEEGFAQVLASADDECSTPQAARESPC